jgi:hypothetical protein
MQLTFEPAVMAVMVSDFVVMLLILSASWTAYQVLLHWNPESAEETQLNLEIASETSSIKVRAGAIAFFFSSMVLIMVIANALPKIVPGAMCGTGVIQATDGMGNRALVFRCLAMFMLFLQYELEKVDRTIPDSILVMVNARLLLMALPMLFLSIIATFRSLSRLNVQEPVDCCAAFYEAVRASADISFIATFPHKWLVVAFITGAFVLLVFGLRIWIASRLQSSHETFWLMIISLIWVIVSWITLVSVLSAYHYQVLNHHCPWCLFLPEHRAVGYPLFGALGLIAFEGSIPWVATRIGQKNPKLDFEVLARIRKAGFRLVSAVIVFVIISGLPALSWKLKYGVWISGNF